jgi:signal transduction histidine kinase
MSDIVWSVNPDNDSFETILIKMKHYLAEICEPADILFDIKIDDTVLTKKLAITKRRDFYLIFKEAINNAVKYAQCKNITAELRFNKNNLQLLIIDDGIGFDENLIKKGNGLTNLQARAKKIDGLLNLTSTIGKGTSVSLTLKLT